MEPSAQRFEGRRALLTGGGSGIGRASALRLAQEGAAVYLVDVNEAGLEETAAGREGIHTWRLDVTDNQAASVKITPLAAAAALAGAACS